MSRQISLNSLKNKRIAILGLGVENYAMLKYLIKTEKIKAEFTICDQRSAEQLADKFNELNKFKNTKWKLGADYNQDLGEFDILFRSPGWPLSCPGIINFLKLPHPPRDFRRRGIKEALKAKPAKSFLSMGFTENTPLTRGAKGVILSSPMRLFLALCPTENIIGVTGTKGKGTTASLIAEILKAGRKKVWLGGNIGIAPFAFLPKIKKSDWVVLELSSFQLEDLDVSPRIAVLTNFYSEHLAPADPNNPNYHKNLRSYWEAKLNILKWQKKGDYAVVNESLEKRIKTDKSKGQIIYFEKSSLPSKLLGEHNRENIAAAQVVAAIAGIGEEAVKKGVAKFQGLEHRLELAGEFAGVRYYNDSFATTPEATITALRSFQEPITLLLGGADKRADFSKLAKIIKQRVKFAVLLDGLATKRIKADLIKAGFNKEKMKLVYDIKEAVVIAKNQAKPGEIVLLSTACASFGMFENYKERGRLFKEEIKKQSHK